MRKITAAILIILLTLLTVSTTFAVETTQVSTKGNTVTVAGKIDETNTNITLQILNEAGTRKHLDQLKTDENGNYSFVFSLEDGEYVGKVSTAHNQHDLSFVVKKGTDSTDSGGSGGSGGGGGSQTPVISAPELSAQPTVVIKTFKDVKDHWAKKEIEALATKGIIKGMDENNFMPESKVTRAQFATLLFNVLELEPERHNGTFSDVKVSAWYATAIEAVANAGVVMGSNGSFNPEKEITREEMAVMVVRAMEYKGLTAVAAPLSFEDKGEISSWAVEYVGKAVNKGIIRGMTDTTFVPKGKATRAQAAVMIYKLMELLGRL